LEKSWLVPRFLKGQPLDQVWIQAGPKKGDVGASVQTYEVGANFEAFMKGVLMAPLDSGYTQDGLNLISLQV